MAKADKAKAELVARAAEISSLSIALDKSDAVAILVSRVEAELQRRDQEQTAIAKEAGEKAKAIRNDVRKLVSEAFAVPAEATKLAESLAKFGREVKASVEADCDQLCRSTDLEKKELSGYLRFVFRDGKYSGMLEFPLKVKTPAAAVKLLKEAVAEDNRESEARRLALEARRGLSQISMIERRARAKLAEDKLSQTDDGQRFLERLTGDFADDLKLLGVSV